MQRLVYRGVYNIGLVEGLQGGERMRGTQSRDGSAVAQLEILHCIFNIYQTTLTVFDVDGTWCH